MLNRLTAEERLASVGDQALASGALEPEAAERRMAWLEDAAGCEKPAPAKANPNVLAAMGIGVVTAPVSTPISAVPETAGKGLSDG